MRLNFDLAAALRVFLVLFALLIFASGCSHNPMMVNVGKRTSIGFDPGQMSASVNWLDGFNVTEISRENTSWELEIDEGQGLSFDTGTNTLRGVRKITRKVGPQVTGYLVKLAKQSPEAAAAYVNQASAINAAEGAKLSPHLVTLPLQQSNGTGISKLRMDKLRQMIAQDEDETVPEGLDMTLEEWQWLKAAYIECPECLALSEEEEAALKQATGK